MTDFSDSMSTSIIPEDLAISGLTDHQQAFANDLVTRHGFESFTEATGVLAFVRGSEPTATQVFQQLVNADNKAKNERTHANRRDNLESVEMSVQASRLQARTEAQARILSNAIEVLESVDVDTLFADEPELKAEFATVLRGAKVLPMKAKNRYDWTMALTPIIDTCNMLGLDINGMSSADELADDQAIALAGTQDSDSDGFGAS
jgi:hypothetical protein